MRLIRVESIQLESLEVTEFRCILVGRTKLNRFVWFCIAACVGTFPAQADFGAGLAAYDAGDYATAREAWQPLAENGDPDALVALASLHVEGVEMRQDYILAVKLFRRAAD